MNDLVEFKIDLEEGWKNLEIVCKFFLTRSAFEKYVFDHKEHENDQALIIFYGDKNNLEKIEICFNINWITNMTIAYELLHASIAYSEYFNPNDPEIDDKEWLCVVHGWLFEKFQGQFYNHFEINKRI